MYCKAFGFSVKPFDVTPNPKFLYLNRSHGEALAAIKYGIQERRGFMALMGEVGTGKTTILQAAIDQLGPEVKYAYIYYTELSFLQMLNWALLDLEFRKSQEQLSKVKALERLNECAIRQLARGGSVIFIIDEAQNLKSRQLENLRLLSNLETAHNKLIQIVIAGQPELDEILGREDMRQFSQRISLRRYIRPLTLEETGEYIQHRLRVADCQNRDIIDRKCLKLIWDFSEGVPRRINILCDNALLIGYGLGKDKIGKAEIEEAIEDLSLGAQYKAVHFQSKDSEDRSPPPSEDSEEGPPLPSEDSEDVPASEALPRRTKRVFLLKAALVAIYTVAMIVGIGLL